MDALRLSVRPGRTCRTGLVFANVLNGAASERTCNLQHLKGLNIANNQIAALLDLSCLQQLDDLHVQFNRLTFKDLEPNVGVARRFGYEP